MRTGHAFELDSIEAFRAELGVDLDLTEDQRDELASRGHTQLLIEQVDRALSLIYPSPGERAEFVRSGPGGNASPSVGLFVINSATWSIMRKKPTHPDKMLPMLSVPLFVYDPEGGSNNMIERVDLGTPVFSVDDDGHQLSIQGRCGDFCGILDTRVSLMRQVKRPLILPGDIRRCSLVPTYKIESFLLRFDIDDGTEVLMYPPPDPILDYTYCESPRVFLENGIRLRTDGSRVSVRIGHGRESRLRGDVVVYIGLPVERLDPADIVNAHLWLRAVALCLSGHGR
ncbi:MAG: hypothetical protein QXS20_01460 [Candidatus Thorarchaeota archaeon]